MSARNGTRSTSGKANDKGKAKVETSKVTISVTSSSGKKVKHLESERVRYQRTGGTKAQSTPSVSPEVSETTMTCAFGWSRSCPNRLQTRRNFVI